jgi:hypothetical protein
VQTSAEVWDAAVHANVTITSGYLHVAGFSQSQCDGMICRFDAFVVKWEYDNQ